MENNTNNTNKTEYQKYIERVRASDEFKQEAIDAYVQKVSKCEKLKQQHIKRNNDINRFLFTTRRGVATFVAAILFVITISVAVPLGFWLSSDDGSNIICNNFVIHNGVLTKYLGTQRNIVIPDGVKAIGQGAFSDRNMVIYTIHFPNSIAYIEKDNFFGEANWDMVAFMHGARPSGFEFADYIRAVIVADEHIDTYFGDNVFPLSAVYEYEFVISQNVLMRYIGRSINIHLPKNVIKIAEKAFRHTRFVENLYIHEGILRIECLPFGYPGHITIIHMQSGLPPQLELAHQSFISYVSCAEFGMIQIRVPYFAVEYYKQTWSDVASLIYI